MAIIDEDNVVEELVVFLRNQNIFSTAQRGVTTITEELDGTGSQLAFVLSNTPVRNVRGVTVGGVSKSLGADYTVVYSTATINFVVAPGAGTDNVDIQYDYGSTDKIYPDWPRPDLALSSFPRIAVDILDIPSRPGGFGNVNESEINFTVVVYDSTTKTIRDYITTIRTAFINNYNDFYYLKIINPTGTGPVISPGDEFHQKILSQNIDFRSKFNLEVNS